jgi:prolyl-tRNA synthetase
LLDNNIEVLYDDRDQSAGAKFADSDLLGIPYRVVVSPKTIEKNSVEIKNRSAKDFQLVEIEKLVEAIK